MKYFVTSDIHGHYYVLVDALKEAGFDEENADHHLLVLGDMFDRGDESKEVFEYLYALHQKNKATIVLGNHDTFMMELLEGNYDRAKFNIARNGFLHTLESFTNHKDSSRLSLKEYKKEIENQYPYMYDWLNSLPLFLELGDYIFVHGGIDPSLKDWKKASKFDFVWTYEVKMDPVPGKTVVAGHHRVATIRKPYERSYKQLFFEHPEYFDPMYLEGKILIDRFVEVSKELNVLVLDL
jgi:serine/threonine protein phosphatase 1